MREPGAVFPPGFPPRLRLGPGSVRGERRQDIPLDRQQLQPGIHLVPAGDRQLVVGLGKRELGTVDRIDLPTPFPREPDGKSKHRE